MRQIAHIINPVKVNKSSDLFNAQPITFETMKIAKMAAKNKVDVELFTAQYKEDRDVIPEGFTVTPDLSCSILDYGSFQEKRKLPLIRDILDQLYKSSNAEYFIFTNVDISLMPYFYLAIDDIIAKGFDSFVINRRTLPMDILSSDQLPFLFTQIGEKHRGYDCFIFKRDNYPKFRLGTSCIGIKGVGALLLLNLICYSTKFNLFKDLHLTFHLGNDKQWKNPQFIDYTEYNAKELKQVLFYFQMEGMLKNQPLANRYLKQFEMQPTYKTILKKVIQKLKMICDFDQV
ncbi:MAG: hypothetical protein JRI86_04160 [Deltaproteobacteria bacterium]|nr:hypothetical protein [Deltaproteobacteria bacterium]